jgi:hypothetical protein
MRENLENFRVLLTLGDLDIVDCLHEAYHDVAACEEDAYKVLAADIKELLNEIAG